MTEEKPLSRPVRIPDYVMEEIVQHASKHDEWESCWTDVLQKYGADTSLVKAEMQRRRYATAAMFLLISHGPTIIAAIAAPSFLIVPLFSNPLGQFFYCFLALCNLAVAPLFCLEKTTIPKSLLVLLFVTPMSTAIFWLPMIIRGLLDVLNTLPAPGG